MQGTRLDPVASQCATALADLRRRLFLVTTFLFGGGILALEVPNTLVPVRFRLHLTCSLAAVRGPPAIPCASTGFRRIPRAIPVRALVNLLVLSGAPQPILIHPAAFPGSHPLKASFFPLMEKPPLFRRRALSVWRC